MRESDYENMDRELEEMTKEDIERTQTIAGCNTIVDLIKAVRDMETVPGSRQIINGSVEAEVIVNVFYKNRHNTESVTRTYGIRKKLVELINGQE